MASLSSALQEQLAGIFQRRFTTDPLECRIYGHDVGTMPRLIKPLIGKAQAEAVVQPKSEEEIIRLVNLAREHCTPLVPRGKATSGYGGVIPVEGGIIVDFWRMREVLTIDEAGMTVTVQPGIVWEDLERELHKRGLDLRLYPSSAPSSTVGGWLAQGGFGYGSFEYGPFRDNVVAVRVVLPNGEVREFAGDDLQLVSDAEGITGIITQITLRVRPLEEEVIVGARFAEARWLRAAIEQVVAEGLPVWSISFINPTMARLKNQLPPKLEHGQAVPREDIPIPEVYCVGFVFPASREAEVRPALERILTANGGERCPQGVARQEWEHRFNIMQVKRLGPSLIPTEVVVPLECLDEVLRDFDETLRLPLAIEGMVAGGESPQVTLLGFIPHDERTLAFNFAFGLSLSAVERAKKFGGRPYTTGLYFAHEAETVLGRERVQRLRAFKREVDPRGLMNPGKVLGNGLLGAFMKMAGAFEPVVRAVGNRARVPVGERMARAGKKDIPDDVAWYAYACAQCGYCVNECDQFYGRGWESESPRGKWFALREYMAGRAEFDQSLVNKFIACTTCEVCNVECPLELPIEPSWLRMRGYLIQDKDKMTLPAFEVMRASLKKERNIWASYSYDRAKWVPEDIKDKILPRAEVGYFPGCTASLVEQDIAQGTARLLDAAGVEFTYLGDGEACCGLPMLVAGMWDAFEEIVRHNINGMKEHGVKTVVTSCPACWLSWKVYYPEWAEKLGITFPFEVKHYSEILAQQIQAGRLRFTRPVNMKVTWHDSCHMGRAGGIYEPPREVLQAIPGLELVEMEHNREHAHCCGSVLTLLENPDTAKVIGDVRVREAEATGAEAIVASCPCCEVQLRVTTQKTQRDLPIIDLAHIASEALGLPTYDPTAYALEQWQTFEAMIWLLKPEAMADLMAELLPQMIEAMPGPFRVMMRMVKRSPGPVRRAMIAMMKPMMPPLFPLLMPGMMPKVLPDMLQAVERRVPMPQHMKEQMPDLMPMAMDNLLPKMLPLVIPHFMPRMIAYLQREE
ncbi:MAG: FAD-binding oxidoreductase [Anaerolineae bacterium]|nr:FAD-binding oxidoreductase [Anaerolineae bacterium]